MPNHLRYGFERTTKLPKDVLASVILPLNSHMHESLCASKWRRGWREWRETGNLNFWNRDLNKSEESEKLKIQLTLTIRNNPVLPIHYFAPKSCPRSMFVEHFQHQFVWLRHDTICGFEECAKDRRNLIKIQLHMKINYLQTSQFRFTFTISSSIHQYVNIL